MHWTLSEDLNTFLNTYIEDLNIFFLIIVFIYSSNISHVMATCSWKQFLNIFKILNQEVTESLLKAE